MSQPCKVSASNCGSNDLTSVLCLALKTILMLESLHGRRCKSREAPLRRKGGDNLGHFLNCRETLTGSRILYDIAHCLRIKYLVIDNSCHLEEYLTRSMGIETFDKESNRLFGQRIAAKTSPLPPKGPLRTKVSIIVITALAQSSRASSLPEITVRPIITPLLERLLYTTNPLLRHHNQPLVDCSSIRLAHSLLTARRVSHCLVNHSAGGCAFRMGRRGSRPYLVHPSPSHESSRESEHPPSSLNLDTH